MGNQLISIPGIQKEETQISPYKSRPVCVKKTQLIIGLPQCLRKFPLPSLPAFLLSPLVFLKPLWSSPWISLALQLPFAYCQYSYFPSPTPYFPVVPLLDKLRCLGSVIFILVAREWRLSFLYPKIWDFAIKDGNNGAPVWHCRLDIWVLILVQTMTSGSWGRALHCTLCSAGGLLKDVLSPSSLAPLPSLK